MAVRLKVIFFLVFICYRRTLGHGSLRDPPQRSSMWREGFPVPRNHDDNGLNCGGYGTQWQRNGGRCGICGDNAQGPLHNEFPGRFATGVIGRTYEAGMEIAVKIQLTANHRGWMELRICRNNENSTPVTQECLDENLLEIAGRGTRYEVSNDDLWIELRVQLPEGLICRQCVLQWTYNAGNNWGCSDRNHQSSCCVGCGPQEQFINCADVKIIPARRNRPGINHSTPRPTIRGISLAKQTPRHTVAMATQTPRPTVSVAPQTRIPTTGMITSPSCHGTSSVTNGNCTPDQCGDGYELSCTGNAANGRLWDTWCRRKCRQRICPQAYCTCDCSMRHMCHAVGIWTTVEGLDNWCTLNCARGFCPASHCTCS